MPHRLLFRMFSYAAGDFCIALHAYLFSALSYVCVLRLSIYIQVSLWIALVLILEFGILTGLVYHHLVSGCGLLSEADYSLVFDHIQSSPSK